MYEVVVFELQRALDISGNTGTSHSLEVIDSKSITEVEQDLSQLYNLEDRKRARRSRVSQLLGRVCTSGAALEV